ncbi:hydrolase [Marivirga lumbricoides]|uniref:Beta-phosphoglucomutase n=1 Tax=Marivirga lumbricoides TaxID=1046115 RepID=A0ABQ1MDN9_9BACT|nr:hydrolase [Marivirga lumbricoides]
MAEMLNQNFEAVILDMDGVITQTARLHAKAWKKMFDDFLQSRDGADFKPLNLDKDYNTFIDGIPRFDGVRSFLKSRNISLPEGGPDEDGQEPSVYSLGMRKNEIFLGLLKKEGVHVYEDTIQTVKKWKKEGLKIAVISSSKNAEYILDSAGVQNLFDVRVDGVISEKEGLSGKPAPDIFLEAAALLGAAPEKTIVVEDAIAGIKAGKSGGFGLVVGVARKGEASEMEDAKADIVVKQLTEIYSSNK